MEKISIISAKAILLHQFGVNTRKAALFVLILLMLPVLAAAQYNVPDANFRTVLSSKYEITFDGANNISNPDAAANIISLDVSLNSIDDLTGIAAFTGLLSLNCSNNLLTSLDVSANTSLKTLNSRVNNLTSLDVSRNTQLIYLLCYNNQLSSLDVSANSALTDLDCRDNQLTSLDVSANTALRILGCDENQLTSLDVSANTELNVLTCSGNQLISLDVSRNTQLIYLHCYNNQLSSLDVSANSALTSLSCYTNQLTSLDVSKNTALTDLQCYTNQLTSLDVSANSALNYFDCHNNQLTSLDVSANTALSYLFCDSNQLTSLDVSANTALTHLYCNINRLTSLDVSANTALTILWCHYNQLTSMDVSTNSALNNLFCRNNRIPIIFSDGHTFSITKDALTQVAILRDSTLDPVIASDTTGAYVLGASGAIVNITTNKGPQSTISSSTGTNPGVVGSLPPGIDILNDKYWTINNADLTGVYNLILDLTPFAVNMNFENLAVLKRADSADPWQDAATIGGVTVQYLEPFVLINGLTSFSDFAIAGSNLAPLTFNLLLPVNEDTLMDLSAAVEFVWQPAVDLNDDSVTYSLRIYGGIDLDTTINVSAETAYTFNGSGLLEHGSEYHWQVFATDGAYTTSSSDTFRFFTPQNIVNSVEDLNGTPKAFSLEQNYPNPFNPSTKIKFNLPKAEHVKIDVYNIRGQKVQQLLNNTLSAGRHQVEFNAQNISSGVYVYKIEAGSFQQIKKMILLK